MYPEEMNKKIEIGRSRILPIKNMIESIWYTINTASPTYNDDARSRYREQLTSCYKTSLALANLYDLKTMAFTVIGAHANDAVRSFRW
jgi:O-acetyl-ADP-ribose deacetylase (regulator of RNase III)